MATLISFNVESLVKQKAGTKGRSWETSLVFRSAHTSVCLCDPWTVVLRLCPSKWCNAPPHLCPPNAHSFSSTELPACPYNSNIFQYAHITVCMIAHAYVLVHKRAVGCCMSHNIRLVTARVSY